MSAQDEFELLLCMRSHTHPDSMVFWNAPHRVARMGKNSIPMLKGKLANSDNEFIISNAIDVLAEMHDENYYECKSDKELLSLMISSIKKMSRHQERAKRILFSISPKAFNEYMHTN